MKKILITIIILSSFIRGWGQCWNNQNTTTTDPFDNSVYDPTISSNPNSTQSPMHWDWTQDATIPVYTTPSLTAPNFFVYNPFYCHGNQDINGGCTNANTLPYSNIVQDPQLNTDPLKLAKALDILPEDGWELVQYSFGEPISTKNPLGISQSRPWFILYNRYTGLLRVMLAMTSSTAAVSADKMVFKVYLDGKERALLSNAQPITQVLQSFNSGLIFNVPNDTRTLSQQTGPSGTILEYYWLMAEVPMAYDPCTCKSFNDFGGTHSRLWFDVFSVSTSTLEANITGSLISTPTPVYTSNNELNTDGVSNTGFFDDLAAGYDGVLKKYNSFQSAATGVKDGLTSLENFANADANKYLHDLKAKYFEEEIKPYYVGVVTEAQIDAMFNQFMNSPNDAVKKLLGMDQGSVPQTDLSALKNLASFVPYVGAAIGVFDFLMGGGKATIPNDASFNSIPAPPTVFSANLKMSGTLTTNVQEASASVFLPGAYPNADFRTSNMANVSNFPMYNNTLGVFNILKQPTFEYYNLDLSETFYEISTTDPNKCYYQHPPTDISNLSISPRQYKIGDDLKYTLNPASKLEVQSIDAAVVFEYPGGTSFTVNNLTQLNNQIQIPYFAGITTNGLTLDQQLEAIKGQGYEIEFMSRDFPASSSSILRIRSKYMPLQCLKEQTFILYGNPSITPKTYLKLYGKFTRTDNTSAEPVTLIQTYDVTDGFHNAPNIGTINAGTISAYSSAPLVNLVYPSWCPPGTSNGSCGINLNAPENIPVVTRGCNLIYDVFYQNVDNINIVINSLGVPNIYTLGNGNGTVMWGVNFPSISNLAYNGSIMIANQPLFFANNKNQATKNIYLGDNVRIASFLPSANDYTLLQAGEKIIFGSNIHINSKTDVFAGKEIAISSNSEDVSINTEVALEIKDNILSLLVNCDNPPVINTFQGNDSEIDNVCTTYPSAIIVRGGDDNQNQTNRRINTESPKIRDSFINNFSFYPNPTNDIITLKFESREDKKVLMNISNLSGVSLKENELILNKGINSYTMSFNEFNSGVYFIKIISLEGEILKAEKLIIAQ